MSTNSNKNKKIKKTNSNGHFADGNGKAAKNFDIHAGRNAFRSNGGKEAIKAN